MRLFLSLVTGIVLTCGVASGQSVCGIAQQPSRWKDKTVSITAQMPLTYHDAALIPSNEPLKYRGECALFPLLPGTPAALTAGVTPDQDSRRSPISRTMRAYRAHLDSKSTEEWCFLASGVVKVINDYHYDQRKAKGNGFGYRGYYRIALLIQGLEKATCPEGSKD